MKRRVPRCTYRVQFGPQFTFADARQLLDYFNLLGVSDLYGSPITQGGEDALNSYQVADVSRIDDRLGGEEELERLSLSLTEREMGFLCDIVPNHMCISTKANKWWNDILENGPSSSYASYFDIDWNPPRNELKNQVLLPVLGDQFGRVLEKGEIQIVWEEGTFHVTYMERRLPLNPQTWSAILEPVVIEMGALFEPSNPTLLELHSILTALAHLPAAIETSTERLVERKREKEVIKQRLGVVLNASKEVSEALKRRLIQINGIPGEPRTFDTLEHLLDRQCYRLCFWRVANHEINYRRFFDVNDLAGLRVEEFEVFLKVHELTFRLVRNGWISGLRVDHVDGLFDPEKYLQELQRGCMIALATDQPETDQLFYVIVEKIFTGAERLRADWPVYGTTGYDFLNLLNGLFIEEENRSAFETLYRRFGGWQQDLTMLIYSCKREVLNVALAAEWHVLARHLDRIAGQGRYSRDFTFENLQEALREMIACFPVYRSYVRAAEGRVTEEDERYVLEAVRRARRLNPTASPLLYDFIRGVVLLEEPAGLSDAQRDARHSFALRFQQLTAPVMAKGVEDMAYYRFYPLVSMSEVGANPCEFGTKTDTFHRENATRLKHWPHSMLATATHDTKRSEDVRARLNVLSEIPDEWEEAIWRWRGLAADIKRKIESEWVPGGNEEYLFYQAVVGAWPVDQGELRAFPERIAQYMAKASREAKVHTSWINPNELYDQALRDFVEEALELDGALARDMKSFVSRVMFPGFYNSLAQVVLKVASPGVPDFYQGNELWDFSLVDPDNRRPVDFVHRVELLRELVSTTEKELELVDSLFAHPEDGRIKLYITARSLSFRRQQASLFREGSYLAVDIEGEHSKHAIAFLRQLGQQSVVACVGRFFAQWRAGPLGQVWGNTQIILPSGEYRNLFTGEVLVCREGLALAEVFAHLPVALLVRS